MSYTDLSNILKVISDPRRLEILDILSCEPKCACDLLEHFSITQPTLSHHMKRLIDQNLVIVNIEGNRSYYQLNHATFEQLTSDIANIAQSDHTCICHNIEKGTCDSL